MKNTAKIFTALVLNYFLFIGLGCGENTENMTAVSPIATPVDGNNADVDNPLVTPPLLGPPAPPPPLCGDGITNFPIEQCDDGNPLVGDGCSGCLWECGNGDIYFAFKREALGPLDPIEEEVIFTERALYEDFCGVPFIPFIPGLGSGGPHNPEIEVCTGDLVPLSETSDLLADWQPREFLSNLTENATSIDGAVLDVNSLNNAIGIWRSPEGPFSNIVSSSYFFGQGWTPFEIISSLELNSADGRKYTSQGDPHVSLNNNNYAVAV